MARPKLSIATIPSALVLPPMAPMFPADDSAASQQVNKITSKQDNEAITPKPASPRSKDKKLVAFRVTRPTARQLEKMAWEEDLTLQAFLLKTINHYRATRGLDHAGERATDVVPDPGRRMGERRDVDDDSHCGS